MKQYKQYKQYINNLTESELPSNVEIRKREPTDRHDIIGWVDHKVFSRTGGRYIKKADLADKKEFGPLSQRIESVITEHGVIFKVDAKRGKIWFMDDELYNNEMIVKWGRPLKPRLLVIYDPAEFGL